MSKKTERKTKHLVTVCWAFALGAVVAVTIPFLGQSERYEAALERVAQLKQHSGAGGIPVIHAEGSSDINQGREPSEVRTTEWFKAHDQERKATLETCANNPGELKDTPKCINAVEAERQLSSGSLRTIDNW